MTMRDLLIVEARAKKELENTGQLKSALAGRGLYPLTRKGRQNLNDEFMLRAVVSVVLDYYTALENIFKEVAKNIDGRLPAGPDWHKDLLTQVGLNLPGLRPPLLSGETFAEVDELRRFRHLARNIYGFNLKPERVISLLEKLPELDKKIESELSCFLEKYRQEMISSIISDNP